MIPIYFTEDFETDSISNLLDRISYVINETDKACVIYLDSLGGSWSAYRALLHYINENKARISIVVTDQASSVAFDLIYNFEGNITILDGSYSIVHRLSSRFSDSKLHDTSSMDYKAKKNLDSLNTPYSFLDKYEKEDFLNGKDVFLDSDRLKEILEDKDYDKL